MIGIKLNNSGQFEFDGQNNLVMIEGDDELMQCVQHIITTNLGEWFLNPTIGWDRFNTLSQKHSEERFVNDITAAVMEGEPRVAAMEDFVFDYDRPGRHLIVKFKFSKFDGEILEGEVTV